MPPRTPRETPKRLQRAAKRPSWERQGGPKTPQGSPGDSQETPRAPKGTLVGCIWTTRTGLGRPQENREIRSVISQKQSSRSRVVRISREEAPKGGQEEPKKSTGSPKEAQVRPKGGSRGPKGAQRRAKRGPREAQEGPKDPKGTPREGQGRLKERPREAKGKPKEAKGGQDRPDTKTDTFLIHFWLHFCSIVDQFLTPFSI